MSSLIQAAAYFLMDSENSGKIFLPGGDETPMLFSKEAAYCALKNALENGLIDKDERNILKQQIDACPLPEKLSRTARQLHHIEDAIEELYQLIEGEFSGPLNDSYGSKDEASPDDTALPPVEKIAGKTTIH